MKNKNEELHKAQNKQDDKFLHSSQARKREKTQQKNFRFPRYPVLGQKAEDYLREEANIEDMPDEKDQENYDEVFHKQKKSAPKTKIQKAEAIVIIDAKNTK